jgi:predicted nucleic acid-binding protein
MSYLLDTCLLSELRKPDPDANVVTWINSIDEARLFIGAVTLGEIQKGIVKLEESKRKRAFQVWLEQDLMERFKGRVLVIDSNVALEWGSLQGRFARLGRPLPVIDSLIAATAICHNLTLVTRNTVDFDRLPVKLLNPWTNQ